MRALDWLAIRCAIVAGVVFCASVGAIAFGLFAAAPILQVSLLVMLGSAALSGVIETLNN